MSQFLPRLDLQQRHLMFRIGRRLGGEKPLYEVAERRWEIAPAERLRLSPAVFLPGQFDKIRAFEPNTRLDIEKPRVFGGDFERPPVVAYRFRDAVLYQGAIFCRGRMRRILPYAIAPPPSKDFPVLEFNEGGLAGTWLGLRYFGHWIKDDATLSLLAGEYGEAVSPAPPVWHAGVHKEEHIPAYARFLDLPWRVAENVRFGTLVMFKDEEITSHKAGRLKRLRERAKAKLGPYPAPKRIFIKRGVADRGARRFNNESAVAEALVKEGFAVIDPTAMTVEEIASAAYGAELVVNMEGSHVNHAIYFARDGASFLAVTPPERFNTPFKQWTELLGMRYGFVVGDPDTEGFSANIDDVRRTMDLFGKA
jgi:hypothetical protein